MTLLTAYNVTHSRHVSDILFMYGFIPEVIWIGFFTFFLIFISILFVGQKVLPQQSKIGALWSTITAFFDQDCYSFSFSDRNSLFSIMFTFLVSVFLFFMSKFIDNSVGTELVVIENAYAPQSYQEILDRRIKVGFNKMLPEYEKFRDSPKGSREWKLFQNKVFFDLQPEAVLSFKEPLVNQELAIAGRRLLTDAVGLAILTMAGPTYPDLRILRTKDPQAKRYTNVFVSNKRSNPALNAVTSKT